MKFIILTVVCLAVIVKSHRFGYGRPGRDFNADIRSELGYDIGTGINMDATAVAKPEAISNGAGIARANEEAVAVANSRRGIVEPRSKAAASNYERGDSAGENQYNTGASGVESQGFHKKGQQNYYNRGHHHSSVTKIEHAETSDEHDIGGSEAFDEGAHKLGAFNKHANGANRYGNDFEKDARQMESTL